MISREAVINAIEKTKSARTDDNEVYVAKVNLLMKIDALPTIQPEIVRCKDCKYTEYIDDVQTLWCTECGQGRTVAPNDFCSYAERREVTT